MPVSCSNFFLQSLHLFRFFVGGSGQPPGPSDPASRRYMFEIEPHIQTGYNGMTSGVLEARAARAGHAGPGVPLACAADRCR